MVLMIILLILCLPLILMLSLFTTTSVVSIVVDVPVNGIDAMVEEVVELDLDKGESFTVDYLISPTEAKNKDVSYSFVRVADGETVEFEVYGNTITPTLAGHFRVTLETVDGGYRDSFDMIVRTRGVESITSTPVKSTITVGEYTDIETVFYPKVVSDETLTYRVKDGEDIVSVSGSGKIRGIGVGTATVEVSSVNNPNAKSEFTVTVESSGVIDFVDNRGYLTAIENAGSIQAVLNPDITVSDYSVLLLDGDGAPLGDGIADVGFDTSSGLVSYNFIDLSYVGVIEVRLTVTPDGGEAVTKSCYIERISEISISWSDLLENGEYVVDSLQSGGESIGIDLKPLGANVSYKIKLEYTSASNVAGEIQSGVEFELEENVTYTAEGGYISVMIESTPAGVSLVVKGTYACDDISKTLTRVYLSVTDENNGNVTELDVISIAVF